MEDLRITPYESWGEMEQYAKEGSRELFLQWYLEQTRPELFAHLDKKMPIVCTLLSETKYVGEFGVEDSHAGEVVVFFG